MAIRELDWSLGLYDEDRMPFDEQRLTVIAPLGDRLVVLVFTEAGDDVRVISLRPATAHEIQRWKEAFYD